MNRVTSSDLVPAPPVYDPAKDPVLEALRAELSTIVQQPLTIPSIRTAVALLQYAEGISTLRRGASGRAKRGRIYPGVAYPVQVGGYDTSIDDGEAQMMLPERTETMGTHALREMVGILTKAVERPAPSAEAARIERASSIGAIARSLEAAKSLPDGAREEAERLLKADLEVILATSARSALDTVTTTGEPAAAAPAPDGPPPLALGLALGVAAELAAREDAMCQPQIDDGSATVMATQMGGA